MVSKVSLFIPCLVDLFLPEIGEATIGLLRRLGVDPIYHEEQTCCGQPALNAGYFDKARTAAKHFLSIFEKDDVIVCPSGSCVHMVKHRYQYLFSNDIHWLQNFEKLSERIYELSQYLVDVLGVVDVGAQFNGKITYHESCQMLRGLGISEQPKRLITSVAGAQFIPLFASDICCGFGGEFSNNYNFISEEMVKEKVNYFLTSGADLLVLCEPGCLLNIRGYLSRHHPEKRVMHLANFLANNGEKQ